MRSKRLIAIVAIAIVAILALTYVTRDGDDGSIVILHSNTPTAITTTGSACPP